MLLCLIVGGVSWYFMYFTKTPEYSLSLIKESVQKHDLEGFKKHVDMDSLFSRGYDDLVIAMVDTDKTMDEGQKKMVAGFAQMLKGTVVTAFKDGITRYVETGEWKAKEEAESQDQQKINTDQMADRTGIKNSSFKGIAYTQKDGATATVGIKIFDESANKEVILDVKMRELNDGTWQIAELSNFKTYLDEIGKGKKENLKKYIEETQPIIDKHNKIAKGIGEEWNEIVKSPSTEAEKVSSIKTLIQNKFLPALKAGTDELSKVTVPIAAENLSKLRTKVIELDGQALSKQMEYLESNDQKVLNDSRLLSQEADGIRKQILKIVENAKAE